MTWHNGLVRLGACSEAVKWARRYKSPAAAWAACDRGDWMLWLLARKSGDAGSDARRTLVLAACACARLALTHVPADEHRPLYAIETAEAWGHHDPSIGPDHVRLAASAAYAAAYAASAAASAASAAASAASAATRADTLLQCADLVRQFYPDAPILA